MRYKRRLALAGHDHTREWRRCDVVAFESACSGKSCGAWEGGARGVVGWVEGDGGLVGSKLVASGGRVETQLEAAALQEQAEEEEEREEREDYHAHDGGDEVEDGDLVASRT